MPRSRTGRGFSLLEVLIASVVITIGGLAGVAYVARASQQADFVRDRIFARQKALSILEELRAFVEGGEGEVAADLDGFDDGNLQSASLSISPDPADPGAPVPPAHKLSGNVADRSEWRWYRRITIRHFPGVNTRDVRICTVRMFRHRPSEALPGDQLAEVTSVVRTVGNAYPTTQVYDVYLLGLENVPGWWVYMDSIKPFIDATLSDLQARNPGLEFRSHWITTAAYGRDEQYAPYTNETRVSTDDTAWAYVYPGKMPSGQASVRYYVPAGMRGRVNLDGVTTPTFANDYAVPEAFTDSNGNGVRDPGEPYTDANANGTYDAGNPVPYALADMQNNAMRWPEEDAKFRARVAASQDSDETPTWRLLLDRMIADPARYHNAIFVNLHGELLAMPAVRNYSDAAKDPVNYRGWRVVTHPELLRPRRTAGNDALSDAPRWRVYGFKTEGFPGASLMTQREPFTDLNKNGVYDAGEPFGDWNASGKWDDEVAATLEIPAIDVSAAPNAAVNPTVIVKSLPGGIDADGNGTADTYTAFANARRYPEVFTDSDGNGRWSRAEPYFDQNGNGAYDVGEPFVDLDQDGGFDPADEPLTDGNGNAFQDGKLPRDVYVDANGNGKWDPAEPFLDVNGDGARNGPTAFPVPVWRAWIPATDNVSAATRAAYAASFGEPYFDRNGNGVWNAAEALTYDSNGNGVYDGGFARGEMWYEVAFDGATKSTVLTLHGTPLDCPKTADNRGIDATARLYDLDYIPCSMRTSAAAGVPAFGRDLYDATANVPKNTARWTVEVPLAQVRKGFETAVGLNNGDASDRILEVRTRIGTDRTTGTMWPTKNVPENLSRAWSYFYSDAGSVPFSERYQFNGDPRHSPYADTDRYGATYPNGYNWYFDNLQTNGTATANWLCLDSARMKAGWKGRNAFDTARYMQWLRGAITKSESVYTTLTGFSYYYLSIGGDVGYDDANGYPNSIPMSGTPFGIAGSVNECTIIPLGTAAINGSNKYVRSNDGASVAMRSGGYWWSKPWIGELSQDSSYATQWRTWGNLRAATGSAASTYRLLRRSDVTTTQQPTGTRMVAGIARLQEEGSTSFFNVGTGSGSTFHHQFADGQTGTLSGDGPQLASNYNFPLPTTTSISRPFNVGAAADGGVGDEYTYTTEFPRYTATGVVDFYNHQNGNRGSSLLRLVEPGGSPRASFVVVNGIDRTTGLGSAFIARYSLITLIHGFLAAGTPGTGRIKQLPRVQVLGPTAITELTNPSTVPVTWKVEWKRWDGKAYTTAYAPTFTEVETDLVYVWMYSRDGGTTWANMKSNSAAEPGVLPWIAGVGRDPAQTFADAGAGDEAWSWPTPSATFPEGNYLIRVETYRSGEKMHYAAHQERIYVNR